MRRTPCLFLVVALVACHGNNGNKEKPDADLGPKPQCSDGIDNDGDGLIDYPNDPGCFAPQQDTEVDDCPDGPACPECGNKKDDDNNRPTDFPDDPGCTAASDTDEYTENPAACGTAVEIQQIPFSHHVMGMLGTGGTAALMGKCGGTGQL